jgi:hypothetical protein
MCLERGSAATVYCSRRKDGNASDDLVTARWCKVVKPDTRVVPLLAA